MQTERMPLAAILATRDASVTKDGLLVNCYEEQTPLGTMIIKRPGLQTIANLGLGCAQGAISFNGEALFIKSDKVYQDFTFTPGGATWTSSAANPFTGARVGSGMASLNGFLYMSGGFLTNTLFADVWRSADGVAWTQITANGGFGARAFHGFVAFNNKLWIIGGCRGNLGGNRIDLSASDDDVWNSSDGITWTQVTAAAGWTGRCQHGVTVHQSNLIIAGGIDNTGTVRNDVWISSNGVTWTAQTAAAGWTARRGLGLVSDGTTLFVVAGGASTGGADDDVWNSSDAGVTWVQVTAVAGFGVRILHQTLFFADLLWVLGGANNAGTLKNDVWHSANGGLTWVQATAAAGWAARAAFSSADHNSTMWVFGGGAVSTVFQDLASALSTDVFFAASGTATASTITPPPPRACLPFQITLIPASGILPVQVFLKNNDVAYLFDGVTFTKVTDPDYPAATVFGVVYLDGTIYVMDAKGVIYGSDINNFTSWSALNFITANAEADGAIALVRQLNYIVAFKEYSTEFFYNAGNATGSPLSKVLNALIEIGCATAGSIAFADNSIYFMGVSRQKGRAIYKMEGYTPKYISNPFIDRILNGDNLAEVYSFIIKSNGHFFYVLTLVTSGLTLIFDEMSGKWHTWTRMLEDSALSATGAVVQADGSILVTMPFAHEQSDGNVVVIAGATPGGVNGEFNLRFDAATMAASQFSYYPVSPVVGVITGAITAQFFTETFFPGVYYSYSTNSNEDLMLDRTTGEVYTFDPTVYEDSDDPINLKVRTTLQDLGVMATKRYSRLELVSDIVTANMLVRMSDDDYQSWTLYRAIPVAARRAMLSNLGSARRRAFEFRQTANVPFRALAAEIDYEVGAF